MGPFRPVEPVPEHRKTHLGKVDPYLVRAAAEKSTANDREALFESRDDICLGARGFAVGVTVKSPAVAPVAGDRPVDLERVGLRMTLDNGNVETLDLAR